MSVSLKFLRVTRSGVSPGGNGVSIKAEYSVEAPEELLSDIRECAERYGEYCIVAAPMTWIIDNEPRSDKGYIDVTGMPYAEFSGFQELAPGVYKVSAQIPESVECDVVFCVYAYSPETDYYTELIGCYGTYKEAESAAEGADVTIRPESRNETYSGEVQVDLGTVSIGAKKTPGRPAEIPWYPGKFLRRIIGV